MDGAGGEPSVRRIGGRATLPGSRVTQEQLPRSNCRGAVTEEQLSRSIFSRNEC
jgi:hypothetical protein